MYRSFLALLFVAALAACSSEPERIATEGSANPQQDGGAPPFVPVNLVVVFGESGYANAYNAADANYLRKKIVSSGLFLRTESDVAISPFTLKIVYESERASGVWPFVKMMCQAVTLFLLPIPQEMDYRIEARLFRSGQQIDDRKYDEKRDVYMSLLLFNQLSFQHAGIDLVFEDMKRDFAERPPLPRVSPPTPAPLPQNAT